MSSRPNNNNYIYILIFLMIALNFKFNVKSKDSNLHEFRLRPEFFIHIYFNP